MLLAACVLWRVSCVGAEQKLPQSLRQGKFNCRNPLGRFHSMVFHSASRSWICSSIFTVAEWSVPKPPPPFRSLLDLAHFTRLAGGAAEEVRQPPQRLSPISGIHVLPCVQNVLLCLGNRKLGVHRRNPSHITASLLCSNTAHLPRPANSKWGWRWEDFKRKPIFR